MKKVLIAVLLAAAAVWADSEDVQKSLDTAEKVIETVEALKSAETIVKKIDDIKHDIETDGKNSKFNLQITHYEASSLGDGAGSEVLGFNGTDSHIQYVTLGMTLLPNTWKISINYSRTYAQSAELEQGPDQIYYVDPEEDTQFFDIYMQPIRRSWGDVGFGYRSFSMPFGVSRNDADVTAVDIIDPATGNPLKSDNSHLELYYVSELQRYYMTYNFPDMKYIPKGLGFKYEYEKSNQGVGIAPLQMALKPENVVHRIGFGIKKPLEAIESGFNFLTLYYSIADHTHEYFNHVTSQNETFTQKSEQIEVQFAIAKKWSDGDLIYFLAELREGEYSAFNDVFSNFMLSVGTIF